MRGQGADCQVFQQKKSVLYRKQAGCFCRLQSASICPRSYCQRPTDTGLKICLSRSSMRALRRPLKLACHQSNLLSIHGVALLGHWLEHYQTLFCTRNAPWPIIGACNTEDWGNCFVRSITHIFPRKGLLVEDSTPAILQTPQREYFFQNTRRGLYQHRSQKISFW